MSNDKPRKDALRRRAALYMRMSTDRQRYSLANQAKVLLAYAESHDIEVIQTYSDAAKSGLSIRGRQALQQLIVDVQARRRPFDMILTYDISRWGRFQDVDESAYYEQLCHQAGVEVVYCTESFCDYEGPMSGILKNLKRTMAAEYSRELSQKIALAHRRLAELGYHVGGKVGFGLRRTIISPTGEILGTLEEGQRRRYPGEKIVVRPGPEHELTIIRRIFYEFSVLKLSPSVIIRGLNDNLKNWPAGRPWTRFKIKHVLINENYIGNLVFQCYGGSLLRKRSHDAPLDVIRHERVFDPIVPVEQFLGAASRFRRRARIIDNETMIKMLKDLYAKEGKVTRFVMDRYQDMPSWTTYRGRFGSLRNAYAIAGVETARDCSFVQHHRMAAAKAANILDVIADNLYRDGRLVVCDRKRNIIHINNAWCVLIKVVRAKMNKAGNLRWRFFIGSTYHTDLCLLVRVDEEGRKILDIYLFPTLSIRKGITLLAVKNDLGTDMYRIKSIADIYPKASRYMDDVVDCMPRLGRTLKGADRIRKRTYSAWNASCQRTCIEKAPR